MNKRENVRAAVDLHCLGLTYPQLHAASAAQASAAVESELDQQLSQQLSQESAAYAAAVTNLVSEQRQAPGPEAAGHLAPGTLAGHQPIAERAVAADVHESPSGTPTARRSARLRTGFSAGSSGGLAELQHSPSAGKCQLCCLLLAYHAPLACEACTHISL